VVAKLAIFFYLSSIFSLAHIFFHVVAKPSEAPCGATLEEGFSPSSQIMDEAKNACQQEKL
jgi:hypothetical protein